MSLFAEGGSKTITYVISRVWEQFAPVGFPDHGSEARQKEARATCSGRAKANHILIQQYRCNEYTPKIDKSNPNGLDVPIEKWSYHILEHKNPLPVKVREFCI
jgi:hypothetical protein